MTYTTQFFTLGQEVGTADMNDMFSTINNVNSSYFTKQNAICSGLSYTQTSTSNNLVFTAGVVRFGDQQNPISTSPQIAITNIAPTTLAITCPDIIGFQYYIVAQLVITQNTANLCTYTATILNTAMTLADIQATSNPLLYLPLYTINNSGGVYTIGTDINTAFNYNNIFNFNYDNATLMGNVFNSANQLLKLDNNGKIPNNNEYLASDTQIGLTQYANNTQSKQNLNNLSITPANLFAMYIMSNTTYIIGASGDFVDLSAFITFINQHTILAGVTVTVNLDNSYTSVESSAVLTFNHPQSSQIVINGYLQIHNITSCITATGTIGNQSITYILDNPFTNLAIGDYVAITNETSTNYILSMTVGSHCGYWQVSNISGNEITVTNTQQMKSLITVDYFNTATITKVTQVYASLTVNNCNGLRLYNLGFVNNGLSPVIIITNSNVLLGGDLAIANTTPYVNGATVIIGNSSISSTAFGGGSFGSYPTAGRLILSGANSTVNNYLSISQTNIIIKELYLSTASQGGAFNNCNIYTLFKCGSFTSLSGQYYFETEFSTNCIGNGNYTSTGEITIQIQNSCNNNNVGNWTYMGNIQISNQVSCSNNTTYNNAVNVGKIIIAGGTSTTNGAVLIANGRGVIVKLKDSSPFTISQ